jgi:hypothetical protein
MVWGYKGNKTYSNKGLLEGAMGVSFKLDEIWILQGGQN